MVANHCSWPTYTLSMHSLADGLLAGLSARDLGTLEMYRYIAIHANSAGRWKHASLFQRAISAETGEGRTAIRSGHPHFRPRMTDYAANCGRSIRSSGGHLNVGIMRVTSPSPPQVCACLDSSVSMTVWRIISSEIGSISANSSTGSWQPASVACQETPERSRLSSVLGVTVTAIGISAGGRAGFCQ